MRRRYDFAVSEGLLMRAVYLSIALLVAFLAGCATNPPPPPRTVYKDVDVPVAVGCVRNRPDAVRPLDQNTSNSAWEAMPTGAKAEAIKAQAGLHQNYEDRLNASVAGCPDAPPAVAGSPASVDAGTPATR